MKGSGLGYREMGRGKGEDREGNRERRWREGGFGDREMGRGKGEDGGRMRTW